ncbi:MAG: hypothetical protein OXQ31_25255 [Spirochaetaceae bacterium]|nr:hypothetical protein [Spirochaetaceae bacterium]
MYDHIKRETLAPYYQDHFDNDGQRFVAWYVQNIHRRDMIGTREDVTDGPDDKQIDAVVVDDEASTVFVMQGKFLAESTVDAQPLREVLSSWVQLKNIVRLQETGNQKLKRRLPEVATALEDEYSVSFELLTTGSLTPAAQDDLAAFQQELADDDDFPAEIHIIDPDEMTTVRHGFGTNEPTPKPQAPARERKVHGDAGRWHELCRRGPVAQGVHTIARHQGRHAVSEERPPIAWAQQSSEQGHKGINIWQ